ncbi:MAG: nuclear transport factor 2 family protein [Acidobacteriota bacterium]|nr:nuclear transport factor 2 family protein [Acidobacteriota bacterium]
MHTGLVILLASLAMAPNLPAQSPDGAIRRVLRDQVAAWNRGDAAAFMLGYDNSPRTTFVGKEVTRGYAQVLARYRERYPTKDNMGTLAFSDLEISPLGDGYASVLGRYHLSRSAAAGGEGQGIFTLLFKRTTAGWKIILDHTS